MITAEQIYHKVQSLDPLSLQELANFLDYLLNKKSMSANSDEIFPETQLETIDTPSVYKGKPLTLEDMNKAIEWEASQSS